MRIFQLIFTLIFFKISCYGQEHLNKDFKDESVFKTYLIANINELDPIEGIWKFHYQWHTYLINNEGQKITSNDGSTDVRLVIYKRYQRYLCCVSDMPFFIWDQTMKGYTEYSFTFEKTAINGKYTYTVDAEGLKEGVAYVNGGEMNIHRKDTNYNNGSNWTTETTINGIKISPNSDDITSAVKQQQPVPNSSPFLSGTAFAIGSDGYIVTAYHVVEGMNSIKVKGINGDYHTSYVSIVVNYDKIKDIAILKVLTDNTGGFNNIPYSLRSSKVRVGEDVFCLGYPLKSSMGEEIKLTNGIISANSGFEGDTTQFQISVPVQPGNSGGPLIDKYGNLIGIITAKHRSAENVSYAVKIKELKKLLESLPVSDFPSTSPLTTKDLPTKVSLIKNFVYIIESTKL